MPQFRHFPEFSLSSFHKAVGFLITQYWMPGRLFQVVKWLLRSCPLDMLTRIESTFNPDVTLLALLRPLPNFWCPYTNIDTNLRSSFPASVMSHFKVKSHLSFAQLLYTQGSLTICPNTVLLAATLTHLPTCKFIPATAQSFPLHRQREDLYFLFLSDFE